MASDKRKLASLEDLYKAGGYTIRYEKGHFRAGHCLVHERQVIVVNKFFDTSARLQKLIDLLSELDFQELDLSEDHQAVLLKHRASAAASKA